jgi:hypothetical protein
MYRHEQRFGWIPMTLLGVALFLLLVTTFFAPLALVAFIPILWAAWTFSLLTIVVGPDTIDWFFRGGFWRKRLVLEDIAEAKPVRNRWWYGWGIHLTPQGWLYNVRGLCAVELRTKSGRRYRIGSDEPETLAAEISKRLTSRSRRP